MMNLQESIKNQLKHVPSTIGVKLSFIDFKYRLGRPYSRYKNIANTTTSKEEIFNSFYDLVRHSEENVAFYKSFYKQNNFSYRDLKNFSDIKDVPIVHKADLLEFSLNNRVSPGINGIKTNTGGTTGQLLELILDPEAYAREWAYIHNIWDKLEYKPSSIKLSFRGLNLKGCPLKYDFIHNDFLVNAFCDFKLVASALEKTLDSYKIEYLYGYPSSIYDFVKQLNERYPSTLNRLKKKLKGVLFASEFPAPHYRSLVEDVLQVPTLSWYGHTEMAVLAPEKDRPFVYYPFQTYGYTESVVINGRNHLVGTTLHNKACPLIRYDTSDIINPLTFNDGLLESFEITGGRTGEFVIDKNGRNISLTSLIFCRQSRLFSHSDYIQVRQPRPGHLIVFVTARNKALNCAELFDLDGIEMDVEFCVIDKPYKTVSGKVPLLIKD